MRSADDLFCILYSTPLFLLEKMNYYKHDYDVSLILKSFDAIRFCTLSRFIAAGF